LSSRPFGARSTICRSVPAERVDASLGGHLKTGHPSTPQNRPPRGSGPRLGLVTPADDPVQVGPVGAVGNRPSVWPVFQAARGRRRALAGVQAGVGGGPACASSKGRPCPRQPRRRPQAASQLGPRGRCSWGVSSRGLLLADVGVDLGAPAARTALEDVSMVKQTVEERGDRGGVAEKLAPVVDWSV
jgi:hypothetical protein